MLLTKAVVYFEFQTCQILNVIYAFQLLTTDQLSPQASAELWGAASGNVWRNPSRKDTLATDDCDRWLPELDSLTGSCHEWAFGGLHGDFLNAWWQRYCQPQLLPFSQWGLLDGRKWVGFLPCKCYKSRRKREHWSYLAKMNRWCTTLTLKATSDHLPAVFGTK